MKPRARSADIRTVARAMRVMRPQGFTLVELMVVMALVGVLVASIYQFFARTSDAMYEAESLAETTDRARFALELIARDMQSAGAFGTPDSGPPGGGSNAQDMWINTTQTAQQNYRVRAIIQQRGHQDRALVALDQSGLATTTNPNVGMDEVVLTGAYDFPFTFEATNIQTGGTGAVTLGNTTRGLLRFGRVDPFDFQVTNTLTTGREKSITGAQRLVRLMDHNGYLQFAITSSSQTAPTAGVQVLALTATPQFMTRRGNDLWGLEPAATEDVGYDAALLDMYRYRVCQDPTDGANLKLVKERLVPTNFLASSLTDSLPPARCGVAQAGVVQPGSQVTIVDRVVDFQIWYDCVPPTGNIRIPWVSRWDTTVGNVDSQAGHNCVLSAGGLEQPGLARIAHVRLSVRTEDERRDVPHYQFIDTAGATGFANAPSATTSSLQTYDLDGDVATAARVMTFQIDVELPNFGSRAPSDATAAVMTP